MNLKKEYKKYYNENFLRFNLDEDQVWKNFDKEFGEERTDELNQLNFYYIFIFFLSSNHLQLSQSLPEIGGLLFSRHFSNSTKVSSM